MGRQTALAAISLTGLVARRSRFGMWDGVDAARAADGLNLLRCAAACVDGVSIACGASRAWVTR